MSGQGFPQVPKRQSFGPFYKDAFPSKSPEKELGAVEINRMAWQSAIISRLAPSVMLRGQDLGGGWAIDYAAFAFDVNEVLPNPAVVDNGDAREITFASHYPNEQGENRRFIPVAAHAFPTYATPAAQNAGTPRDLLTYVNGQTVGVEFRVIGGATVTPEPAVILVWGVSQ